MSSLRFTGFVFVVFLFCLLNVSCPFAQSVLAKEENPQLIKKSVLKISSRTSLRVNKGLLAQYEVASDFAENGSEVGGAIARKMRNLLGDNSKVNSHETGEEGEGSSRGKRSRISEGEDEKYPGFTGNTMKVGLDVRHRLRLRSTRKGQDVITGGRHLATPPSQNHHGGSTDAEKEEMMNLMHRDYRYIARHPPPINN